MNPDCCPLRTLRPLRFDAFAVAGRASLTRRVSRVKRVYVEGAAKSACNIGLLIVEIVAVWKGRGAMPRAD